MATLLLIICIAITVVGILLMNEWDYDLLGYILLILGLVSAIVFGSGFWQSHQSKNIDVSNRKQEYRRASRYTS